MPEAIFRPNDSLLTTLGEAMREDGCGFFERQLAKSKVRRMSANQRQELERRLTAKVQASVEAGELKLPVSSSIVGGVLVSSWQDLFKWFVENLPAILEMIATIMALFAASSDVPVAGIAAFLAVGLLLCGEAFAQCPGGTCTRPATPVRSAVQAAATVARPIVQGSSAATCGARTPKGSTPRGRLFPRIFRRWR